MIRLCALLPTGEVDEALAMAARLGIWGTGASFPPGTTAEQAAALGRRYREAGLRIVQVGCYRNVATPVEEVRAEAAADLAEALALATAAGALAVVTGAGHADPERARQPFAAHAGTFAQAALDRLARTCRDALAAAPDTTARLLVETWVISPLGTLVRAAEAVRRVAHPRFGILFDPVNLMNLDNYFDNGSFLRAAVARLGPAIGLVHAKDTLLHPERFTFQLAEEPPGRGALDYPALLQALATLPGDVPLCVEHLGSEGEISAALGYLRGLGERVGIPLG